MPKKYFSRSEFISLAGSATLLAMAGGYNAFARAPAGTLVDTPEKRLAYTRKMLKKLCTDLGPRPAGSAAFAKGAKIIMEEMKLSLPQSGYDGFEFEKWELVGASEFILGNQPIEAVITYGGEGTPKEGIKGVLEKTGNAFSLVDAITGEPKARFAIATYKAIPRDQSRPGHPPALPTFSIGKQDVPLLERGVQYKTPAWIKAEVRFIPNAKGLNIIGTLPGKKKEEIMFFAHADTMYTTPGANDNTASVIVMLMLAHAAAARGCDHTLTIMAADCEEFGFMGAKHYAEKRISEDTMKNIRYIVNFDSLTYGPNLRIESKDESVKDVIRTIHKDLNIRAIPTFNENDGFVMDSGPFRPSGAKAMHAGSNGFDEKVRPVYHRPDDNADSVPLECVEIGFLVFDEFIRRVDKL